MILAVYHTQQMIIHSNIPKNAHSNQLNKNKKVLLRERKRHTARRVVSTPVVLPGYPPPGGSRYPPGGVPSQVPPPGSPGTPPGVPSQVPPQPRGGGYPTPRGYLVRYPPRGRGGYPVRYPRGGTRSGPPGGYPVRSRPGGGTRTPPGVYLTGYPPRGYLTGYPPCCLMAFWEMLQSIMGYGYPPRCGQTNKVKLLPSRRTTYAGGKNYQSPSDNRCY